MSRNQELDPIDAGVRTLQIIHVALATGVLFFLAITVLVLREGELLGKQPWAVTLLITLVAVLFGAAAIVAHMVLPGLIVSSQRKALARTPRTGAEDFESMVMLYQTQKIIGSTFLEGAAFFNVIAYLLEGTALPLILTLLLLVLLVSRIPSRDGMRRWIDAQLAQLREERHLG